MRKTYILIFILVDGEYLTCGSNMPINRKQYKMLKKKGYIDLIEFPGSGLPVKRIRPAAYIVCNPISASKSVKHFLKEFNPKQYTYRSFV